MSELNVNEGAWTDVEFEVALDSGSQDHVCDEADTPGYVLTASPGVIVARISSRAMADESRTLDKRN